MRWLLATLALALAACGDSQTFADPVLVEVAAFPAVPATKLDVLFVMDDSNGGPEMQDAVAAGLDKLLGTLEAVPGGMPSLHVGVVTSDLGTTGSLALGQPGPQIGSLGQGGCGGEGKNGALQTSGAEVMGTFVVDEPDGAGGRTVNYVGDLAAVLSTLIRVGAGGCGFEQPFHAIRRAFENPSNTGFARADAHLAIILVTDEDDCSFLDPALVDPAAPLGPLQSFRCTSQGITCDQSLDEVGEKTGCHAREDSPYIEPTALTAEFLVGLKAHPAMVSLSAIAGDPSPVNIELRPPPGGGIGDLALGHSCSYTGANGLSVADPGVRVRDLVSALEGRAALTSICADDLSPQLTTISRVITPAFGVTCLDTTQLADASTELGVQPTCELTLERGAEKTPLPACPSDGDCYELVADATACPDSADHLRLVTHLAAPLADTYVRARCEPFRPR